MKRKLIVTKTRVFERQMRKIPVLETWQMATSRHSLNSAHCESDKGDAFLIKVSLVGFHMNKQAFHFLMEENIWSWDQTWEEPYTDCFLRARHCPSGPEHRAHRPTSCLLLYRRHHWGLWHPHFKAAKGFGWIGAESGYNLLSLENMDCCFIFFLGPVCFVQHISTFSSHSK